MAEYKDYRKLAEIIERLDDNEIVEVHNNYCEEVNYPDDIIYSMAEFDDLVTGTASEIINQISVSDFNLNDDYFVFDIYGIKSFSWMGDGGCPVDADEIAQYAIDNEEDFGNNEISEFLEELADREDDGWNDEDEE